MARAATAGLEGILPFEFRGPGEADFPVLAEIRRDPFMQGMLLSIPDRIDDAAVADWIQRRMSEPGGLFQVIVDRSSGRSIGFIQINNVNTLHNTGYGALAISRQSGKRGVGPFALRELMRAAGEDLGIRSLLAEIRADNAPSLQLHRDLGYRQVGILDDHFADHDFRYHDVILMQRLLGA